MIVIATGFVQKWSQYKVFPQRLPRTIRDNFKGKPTKRVATRRVIRQCRQVVAIATGFVQRSHRIHNFSDQAHEAHKHTTKATRRVIRQCRQVVVIATGFVQKFSQDSQFQQPGPRSTQPHNKSDATRCQTLPSSGCHCPGFVQKFSQGSQFQQPGPRSTQPHNKSDATRYQTVASSGCDCHRFCEKVFTGMTVEDIFLEEKMEQVSNIWDGICNAKSEANASIDHHFESYCQQGDREAGIF